MKNIANGHLWWVLMFSVMLFSGGCNSSRAVKGAGIGAGAGAAVGAAVGAVTGNTARGAIIGAAVGGVAGGAIGRHMDKQAAELRRDLKGATVERVGEGIKVTFNSGLLFDTGSSDLRPAGQENVSNLANTLNKYPDTNIVVEGHTDDVGTDENNQSLSERRANTVTNILKSRGVASNRITTSGYGEKQPVADNTSESGRQANRRVEVAIFANERMKKAAERGDL